MREDMPAGRQEIQLEKSFILRFWWIGAIVVVLVLGLTLFLNSRNNNKDGKDQSYKELEQQEKEMYEREHALKDAKPLEDKKGRVETPVISNKPPLLKNLAVDFAPYDSSTDTAGAFKFTTAEEKLFYEFGAGVNGSEGYKLLPTFEYRVNPAATVYVAADGYVDYVKYQEDSRDYEIVIMAEQASVWGIVYDHIKNPAVQEKTNVTAGQKLGNPGTWNKGLGRTEIQIVQFDGKGTTYSYCPFKYFDPALVAEFKQKVTTMMSDWENYKSSAGIYDQAKDISPGCPYDSLKQTGNEGVQVP